MSSKRSEVAFSVIIPCYNRAELLGRAIESVLAQGDLAAQIIVIDDGSTDNTKDVCAQFGNRIEYLWQENAGASVARNKGVNRARNLWVAFLDSDDHWAPSHLANMARAIEETSGKAMFYFSDLRMNGQNGETSLWRLSNFSPPKPVCVVDDGTNWAFLRWQPMILQTSVFRKDVWLKEGGLDRRFSVTHDTELFFRLSIGRKICAVSPVGCIYSDDDLSDLRLTKDAILKTDYWEQVILLRRELLQRFPSLPPRYRTLVRRSLASAHWRLVRLHWRLGNRFKAALSLPAVGWSDPSFMFSLLVHRRAGVNVPILQPEYNS